MNIGKLLPNTFVQLTHESIGKESQKLVHQTYPGGISKFTGLDDISDTKISRLDRIIF